jgi:hypothetical protein
MGWGHLNIFFSRTTGLILTRLGTSHPWDEGLKFVQIKGIAPLQGKVITYSKKVKNTLKIFKNFLLHNQLAKINQTLYKSFLGEGNSSLFN